MAQRTMLRCSILSLLFLATSLSGCSFPSDPVPIRISIVSPVESQFGFTVPEDQTGSVRLTIANLDIGEQYRFDSDDLEHLGNGEYSITVRHGDGGFFSDLYGANIIGDGEHYRADLRIGDRLVGTREVRFTDGEFRPPSGDGFTATYDASIHIDDSGGAPIRTQGTLTLSGSPEQSLSQLDATGSIRGQSDAGTIWDVDITTMNLQERNGETTMAIIESSGTFTNEVNGGTLHGEISSRANFIGHEWKTDADGNSIWAERSLTVEDIDYRMGTERMQEHTETTEWSDPSTQATFWSTGWSETTQDGRTDRTEWDTAVEEPGGQPTLGDFEGRIPYPMQPGDSFTHDAGGVTVAYEVSGPERRQYLDRTWETLLVEGKSTSSTGSWRTWIVSTGVYAGVPLEYDINVGMNEETQAARATIQTLQ